MPHSVLAAFADFRPAASQGILPVITPLWASNETRSTALKGPL